MVEGVPQGTKKLEDPNPVKVDPAIPSARVPEPKDLSPPEVLEILETEIPEPVKPRDTSDEIKIQVSEVLPIEASITLATLGAAAYVASNAPVKKDELTQAEIDAENAENDLFTGNSAAANEARIMAVMRGEGGPINAVYVDKDDRARNAEKEKISDILLLNMLSPLGQEILNDINALEDRVDLWHERTKNLMENRIPEALSQYNDSLARVQALGAEINRDASQVAEGMKNVVLVYVPIEGKEEVDQVAVFRGQDGNFYYTDRSGNSVQFNDPEQLAAIQRQIAEGKRVDQDSARQFNDMWYRFRDKNEEFGRASQDAAAKYKDLMTLREELVKAKEELPQTEQELQRIKDKLAQIDPNSEEGKQLKERLDLLEQKVEAQRQASAKIDEYQQKLDSIVTRMGDARSPAEFAALQQEIDTLQSQKQTVETNLTDINSTIDDLNKRLNAEKDLYQLSKDSVTIKGDSSSVVGSVVFKDKDGYYTYAPHTGGFSYKIPVTDEAQIRDIEAQVAAGKSLGSTETLKKMQAIIDLDKDQEKCSMDYSAHRGQAYDTQEYTRATQATEAAKAALETGTKNSVKIEGNAVVYAAGKDNYYVELVNNDGTTTKYPLNEMSKQDQEKYGAEIKKQLAEGKTLGTEETRTLAKKVATAQAQEEKVLAQQTVNGLEKSTAATATPQATPAKTSAANEMEAPGEPLNAPDMNSHFTAAAQQQPTMTNGLGQNLDAANDPNFNSRSTGLNA